MKTHVIFHGDHDGFASWWALWLLKGRPSDYVCHEANYGVQALSILDLIDSGDKVYILDFSFPRDVIEGLAARTELLLLDHHLTSAQNLAGLPYCVIDQARAGCTLTADTIKPENGGSIAKYQRDLIERVADRDLWRFAYPNTRAVTAGLGLYPNDLRVWSNLDCETLETEGEIVLRVLQQQIEGAVKKAHWITVETPSGLLRCPAVCCTENHSAVANTLLKMHPESKAAIVYRISADGSCCYSMRSRGDFDVSEVCKQFGGGGHRAAAGNAIPIGKMTFHPHIIHEWITP